MKARGPFCIRHAAADTFAMVVFCFVSGMIIEIFISGMTFEQSLASRTLSIPVNIAIAWPYGVFRDFVLRLGRKWSNSNLMKSISDLIAFVLFQSPVYAAILLVVGASTEQIITAVSSNAIVSCGMGVLYGYFLDMCRRWFRVPGYYQSM
ncbi:L-alanine exporter AlaE [Vibrio aestuarianus]|uniref:L-alanine exporter AlaE n=1 Tax=Vibrio aestuarianus TaxID=28171 RepID=A0A7X6S5M6_9VIBR|nr:L-alanine exporter AlaE [Vibrio aestuarianus]MDE1208991.1 L-alanine exporter AlaE [Vibrio aestuarianus]MDE1213721.1 L-alanine exporter AlaE [Vibrio aestuarianus]MDE1217177.1 L-alanine exporter AlaE [Vibrio aestuarianus]MDE1219647.1 L-alanine exporter AlaE [Vibrio aestuarianus]MDE1223974.1 L-alanine exporter AlaE [Vibrio aestuarianus]